MTLRLIALASLALAAVPGAHASTFALSSVPVGTVPTFSIAAGGTTAAFSSTAGNGFVVGNTAGLLSFSTALEDTSFFGTDPLVITFSQPVSNEITIPFAVFDAFGTGDTLSVAAGADPARVFSTRGDNLPLDEPEGLIAFVPSAPVRQLTLTSAQAFAIGNVTVPEPMSLSLLGMGLAGLAIQRRAKRG